ncbi:hypothetical protein D4R49_00175 [bacterium]|nr:MAG: hypothetical protein D4R49_00175 [bacterium]
MAIVQEGSNIVVSSSVAGSVFPTSEKELAFPVLVDGSTTPIRIEGAVYGRSLELRGNVVVDGPIVARGDTRITPRSGCVVLRSGLTVNGSLTVLLEGSEYQKSILENIENASVIIKGDISVNQNIALKNSIVFGSLRAVNCSLDNSLVLGTCIVNESLKVSMSSIGGYASRDVTFEGNCVMLHALGESHTQPLFVPFEKEDGSIFGADVRYYPAIRGTKSMINRLRLIEDQYPAYSALFPTTDWVCAQATSNPALEEDREEPLPKWVLSIGGRICDISKIAEAIKRLTQMLKCGFEYEHYEPRHRAALLKTALVGLTVEEQWILNSVCV